uniref:Squalene synthase n=1 Tax=Geotrypetes seraphini TaxID=260995 RepID=A0A6P8Q991_GEOSA|nr:squalene synthase-like isoform X4 [Geotrypetes seraphini]
MDILKSLVHPTELYKLLKFKMSGRVATMHKLDLDSISDSLKICYKYLNETSRSFAAVIQTLDGELRHAVCIFYLVVRALDTIEDDMTIALETKVPMLHDFHTYLYQPEWRYAESKDKYKQVLEDFTTYGHYASGLVGIGFSLLISASEQEDPTVVQNTELVNSLGLFLQKTNIIRDYLQDQLEGREFWPREVWGKYTKKLSDLAKPENIDMAVQCMNELITNALHHVPDVLTYLSRLKNQSVFNFCAIPLVMAIATLAACYNNQKVFKGVVKIRKGQAITLIMDATNIQAVKAKIYQYAEEIYQKIPISNPSSRKTHRIILCIRNLSFPNGTLVSRNHFSPVYLYCAMLLAALSWQYLSAMSSDEYVQASEN